MDTINLHHPLSPGTPPIIQWVHEESMHGSRNRRNSQAQQYECPLTNVSLATAITECPICQQQAATLSP